MFDIGWSEILVIVIITILVVGPKELPGLLRTVGKTVGNMRRMAGDFQNQFNEALREAELDDVKNTISDVRKLNPATAVKDAVQNEIGSLSDLTSDVSSDLKEIDNKVRQTTSESGGANNSAQADLVSEEPVPAPPPPPVSNPEVADVAPVPSEDGLASLPAGTDEGKPSDNDGSKQKAD